MNEKEREKERSLEDWPFPRMDKRMGNGSKTRDNLIKAALIRQREILLARNFIATAAGDTINVLRGSCHTTRTFHFFVRTSFPGIIEKLHLKNRIFPEISPLEAARRWSTKLASRTGRHLGHELSFPIVFLIATWIMKISIIPMRSLSRKAYI